jgi:hypothetical protein
LRERKLARVWLYQILRREALGSWTGPCEAYMKGQDERVGTDAVFSREQRLDILAFLCALRRC